MNNIALLILIVASIVYSNALTVGPFQNVTNGIWSSWNNTDPDNVRQGRFGMRYGNDNLWLVSRRLYRKGFGDPWDPASRGGIVSTFDVSDSNWTHKSYQRLDEDTYGDKLFSLNGRLFMLTYGTNQKKIVYHKLFFWDDESGRWLETPFEIDPTASTVTTNEIAFLSVTVPDQARKIAYFVASAHGYATAGSEMVYSKFEAEFRGNIPVKATLKTIAREQGREPSAVHFTAVKNDILYAFVQNMYSEGYESEISLAYTVDLKTYKVGNVTLSGAPPPMGFEEERMFQTNDEIFIAGGSQVVGLGHLRHVDDIWALSLTDFQWRGTNAKLPQNAGDTLAFDRGNKTLYVAGLKEGVSAAQISA